MNECSTGEERGTVFSSGHIYFLRCDPRLHDFEGCKAEGIQLELNSLPK